MIVVETTLPKEKVEESAIAFFAGRGYVPLSKTSETIIFQGGKDFSVTLFIILLIFGFLILGLFYYLLCGPKSVVVEMKKEGKKTGISVKWMTGGSKYDALGFQEMLKNLDTNLKVTTKD